MPQTVTCILRIELAHDKSIYRDIEIGSAQSLYKLAETIVDAFGFDLDHAFGFYSGLTHRDMLDKHPKYELFADLGYTDAAPGVIGVEKTKVGTAFPVMGHKMIFLFDYGDEWLFRVTLKELGRKVAKTSYPRVTASQGKAPEQYPDEDASDDDGPTWAINPVTGEKFMIGK